MLAPLSQTIFLTEDGSTVLNPKAVTIPPIIPSLTNTLRTSALPLVKVRGGVPAFDSFDQQLQELGDFVVTPEVEAMLAEIENAAETMKLADFIAAFQAILDVLKASQPSRFWSNPFWSNPFWDRKAKGK